MGSRVDIHSAPTLAAIEEATWVGDTHLSFAKTILDFDPITLFGARAPGAAGGTICPRGSWARRETCCPLFGLEARVVPKGKR